MIKPGQVLSRTDEQPPVVRVVCRYPFDGSGAAPRWVVEHINQPGRVVEIVDEERLIGRQVLFTVPLVASLEGSS